jgi:bacterial/archaeal transporter family-2 protein
MSVRLLVFFLIGTGAGALITVQSVLNAALGKRSGSLGSVLLLTLVSIALLIPLVLLIPGTADLRQLPGLSQWYLYAGGLLGIAILATPIVLVPRIGATATLTALVAGQLTLAVVVDHFGVLGVPRVEITATRMLGLALLVGGALLVTRR